MTPIEPPPSAFWLPDPDSAGDEDLVAVGGDLAPGTILQAYRRGMFPDASFRWPARLVVSVSTGRHPG